MADNIIRKHTVSQMESEMDRLVKDRERLGSDLDQFIKAKGEALKLKDPVSCTINFETRQVQCLKVSTKKESFIC